MRSTVTRVTDRGQVSVPASVRKRLGLEPGTRLAWEPVSDRECRVVVEAPVRPEGPLAVLGFARSFRATRTTAAWLRDLRAGERA